MGLEGPPPELCRGREIWGFMLDICSGKVIVCIMVMGLRCSPITVRTYTGTTAVGGAVQARSNMCIVSGKDSFWFVEVYDVVGVRSAVRKDSTFPIARCS